MIRINLVRGKRKKKREFNLESLILVVPLLVLVGVFFFHQSVGRKIDTLESDIQKANARIELLKKEIGEVEKFKVRKAELQKKVDIISNLQTGRVGPVKILDGISSVIPLNVFPSMTKSPVEGSRAPRWRLLSHPRLRPLPHSAASTTRSSVSAVLIFSQALPREPAS